MFADVTGGTDMRVLVASMALLLAAVADSPGNEDLRIEQRIHRIENGLVEFTAPINMLQPRAMDTSGVKTMTNRMAHYKVPGVSIAVINGNRVDWARAYGTTRVGSAVPVTTGTLFEAASTSKLIVSAIALRFVEQGLLDLDADVNMKLKSWKIPENARTEENKVTLRRLLTHQSGLNRPEGGLSWEEGSTPTLLQTLNGAAPATNEPAAVEFTPGLEWHYSNFGYLVIQLLIEDVMGEPFSQVARRTVFEPLGMKSSTFEVPLDAALKKNEAVPHDAGGAAHEPEMHPTAVANGGLMTTPTDLALFTRELILAYRGESGRVLSRETVRMMFHGELDLDPAILGVPLEEGLGVLLFGKGEGFSFLHPGDNLPGSSSWLIGYPETGNGIVVMTNGAMGNLLAMEIVAATINEYDWPIAHDSAE